MAIFEVKKYVLIYDDLNTQPHIMLQHIGPAGGQITVELFPTPENALFIADMLRNEKPVYWNTVEKCVTTSKEPVGEEET